MNDDDEPDTYRHLARAVTGPGHLPGPTTCGCRPTAGESCPRCSGPASDRWDALRVENLRLDPHWRALHERWEREQAEKGAA